jgi:GntR family transcriptional regulator
MQPEPTPGLVPIHHQIADQIRARIASGDLQPGDALPSVGDICSTWGCSPGSARTAIGVLKAEGLISGGRGKPATVRKPAVRVRLTLDGVLEPKRLVLRPRHERAATGALELTAGISITNVNSSYKYSVIPANSELAGELGVSEGDSLLRRGYETTDRDTGTRISWSISYIPVELIESNPDLLDETKEPWPGGHLHQLYTVGIEIDRFERSIIAVEPSPADRHKWAMETGVPLLYVRSRSIDIAGRVAELSDAAYPADRTEITFTEHLERWPANYPRYSQEVDWTDR